MLSVLPKLLDEIWAAGVHTISMWGFSTDNWKRPPAEIACLMDIFQTFVDDVLPPLLSRNGARVIHLGRKDRLPERLVSSMRALESATALTTGHVLNAALDYGGRDEIQRALERVRRHVSRDGLTADAQLDIVDFLDTGDQPYPSPDIVMRTSGEQRLSGFMPVQLEYAELFFIPQHFPDVTFETIDSIVTQYRNRLRRFGK